MSKDSRPGHVLVEVVSGPAGPSLYIGDNHSMERVAGPKPWGGGSTIHVFEVKTKDLSRIASEYEREGGAA